jgi:hypothetical protein
MSKRHEAAEEGYPQAVGVVGVISVTIGKAGRSPDPEGSMHTKKRA